MAKMPPMPPKNRSRKGPADVHPNVTQPPVVEDRKHHNADEQGETANIKQNTTNQGYFHGRRVK